MSGAHRSLRHLDRRSPLPHRFRWELSPPASRQMIFPGDGAHLSRPLNSPIRLPPCCRTKTLVAGPLHLPHKRRRRRRPRLVVHLPGPLILLIIPGVSLERGASSLSAILETGRMVGRSRRMTQSLEIVHQLPDVEMNDSRLCHVGSPFTQ